jgi:AAA domain
MTFHSLLSCAEQRYDAILFDVAPSISHLQSCAIANTRSVAIPVAMDSLSIEGARSSLQTNRGAEPFLAAGMSLHWFLADNDRPASFGHRSCFERAGIAVTIVWYRSTPFDPDGPSNQ